MKKSTLISLFLISAAITGPALADYAGPVQNQVNSLKSIIDNPVDEQMVKLEGYLIEKTGTEKYIFSDGKQQIEVDIDEGLLPAESFDHNQKLVISGELETDSNEPLEIDVNNLTLVKK